MVTCRVPGFVRQTVWRCISANVSFVAGCLALTRCLATHTLPWLITWVPSQENRTRWIYTMLIPQPRCHVSDLGVQCLDVHPRWPSHHGSLPTAGYTRPLHATPTTVSRSAHRLPRVYSADCDHESREFTGSGKSSSKQSPSPVPFPVSIEYVSVSNKQIQPQCVTERSFFTTQPTMIVPVFITYTRITCKGPFC